MAATTHQRRRPRPKVPTLIIAACAAICAGTPAQSQTTPPAAPPAAPAPSAAVAAAIADAHAKVKAGQFAEAVAALMAAKTDGLPPADKQALDFVIADTQQAWGWHLLQTSRYDESLGHLNAALAIDSRAPARLAQSGTDLRWIGIAYDYLSQHAKAIDYYGQALAISRQVKDRDGEAKALMDTGIAYDSLSQYEKAIGLYEQALPIFQRVKDRDAEALGLMNLGFAYRNLSQYDKAIGYYEQALTIFRQVKDRNREATALDDLGNACVDLSQYEKAIGYLEQALTIYRQVKERDGEADALTNLGFAYSNLSQYEKAISYYEQALPIYRQAKDRNGEVRALDNLAQVWSAKNYTSRNPDLAILFGKQAVNVLQTIRADQHGLDKQMQQGFAKSKESFYRHLADLLIAQHRLPEALQVLDLLKQEEYLNFNKPAAGKSNSDASLASTANLTVREQQCSDALEAASGALKQDASNLGQLQNVKQPTQAQQDQLAAATAKEAVDGSKYQKILASFTSAFPNKPDPVLNQLQETTNSRDLQAALRMLGDGSVAVYTLVSDNKLRLLLVTPNRIVARDAPLKDVGDLDKKIAAFREALKDAYYDPRPSGKQLYDLLISPIKADLDAAHAKTLLVALDGNLRYIPLAALSPDWNHYLVETYRTALYTPAAIANLTRTPKPKWTAVAMGVSKEKPGFRALKAVPGELKTVVRTERETGPDVGQFPGTRLLDDAFTKKAMVSALDKSYPLVHIASHFVFTGDESTSFLLLGDGAHMTLSDLKALPDGIFAGVNLLTLSACETATGGIAAKGAGNRNGGRDVENVAVLAQRKGADAVLASLWSVSDESTGSLMRTFYRDRQGGGAAGGAGESKAEALRHAQIALLNGTAKSLPNVPVAKRSELLSPAPAAKAVIGAPAFKPDPAKPWAHPYYWAPFILIGNWK